MLTALLTLLLVILIICVVAYGASRVVDLFLAPVDARIASLAKLAIGLIALIAIVLYAIRVLPPLGL